MTKDEELIERWRAEQGTYLAWGKHLSARIVEALEPIIAPVAPKHFLKASVSPRLKDEQKLIEKAFYRGKQYADPYSEITDKVGTRFVVLLGSDITTVVQTLKGIRGWTCSCDRDYEEEQNKNPLVFDYAAVHFVVRPGRDIQVGPTLVPAATPCEVQIKTILQHAYSELTHDTIYKPQIDATPVMRRNAAKSMALLEATNDYFERVAQEVNAALNSVREITRKLSDVYAGTIGIDPKPSVLEGLLLSAYEADLPEDYIHRVRELMANKPFLAERIRERVGRQSPLFAQPAVLLAYLEATTAINRAIRNWPLTRDEMEPLLNDIGESLRG
jgi:ppGpp synthetase/RelA/SpoT-type nucleotidyltranferase